MTDYITYTGQVEVPRSEYATDPLAARLTDLFGPQCGLNAEWSVRAWHILGTCPNRCLGVYLLDQEDGTWTLTWRRHDWTHELKSYTSARLLLLMDMDDPREHLREIAHGAIVTHFTPPTP